MKTKKVSLIGLFYQGKDDEILRVLNVSCSMKRVSDDLKKALQIESREVTRLIFDPDEQDRFGHSIFNLLLEHGYEQLALALWRAGADEMKKDGAGNIPMFQAIRRGYDRLVLAIVGAMVAEGTGDLLLNRYEFDGQSSVFSVAVDLSSLEVVEAMLKAGANPLSEDRFGDSPLCSAAEKGFGHKVELMLKFLPEGTDKNTLNVVAFMAANDTIAAMIRNAIAEI